MKTIAWTLENGMVCCDLTGEVEVESAATDDDIEAAVREDMWDRLSLTWHVMTDKSPQGTSNGS